MSNRMPVPPASRRRLWIVLAWVGAACVIVGVVAVLFVWRDVGAGPDSSMPTSKAPTSSTPATSKPTKPHPTSCAEIYTKDWAILAPLVLNPAWADAPGSGVRFGTDDADLEAVLKATTGVTCVWAAAGGGSGEGLTTNVAFLTDAQQASVEARLKVLGFTCSEQQGGLRCDIDHVTEEGAWGESHFIRDGIWIATNWVNSHPDGYTEDIVSAVFEGH